MIKSTWIIAIMSVVIAILCIIASMMGYLFVEPQNDAYARWTRGGIYSPGRISYSQELECIIVTSPISGRGDLYGISPLSGDIVWSLKSATNEIYPTTAGDGRILFSRYCNGSYIAVSCSPQKLDEYTILADFGDITSPTLLPDLSAIVFAKKMSDAPASLTEVWIKPLPDGAPKRLTHNAVYDGVISALGDSSRIIYNKEYSQVCILDLATGKSNIVCAGAFPSLSLDERSVYCVRKRPTTYSWDLVKHELNTGQEVLYTLDGSYMSAVCCLPGERVAVVYDVLSDRVGKLAILDTSTGRWSEVGRLLEISKN